MFYDFLYDFVELPVFARTEKGLKALGRIHVKSFTPILPGHILKELQQREGQDRVMYVCRKNTEFPLTAMMRMTLLTRM